jgi:multidrug efflux pump subunit AcrA (membrane-fusion protein)
VPVATITAEAAKSEEWIERLPAIGTLIASQGVEVASQVAGIVTGLGFESGQDVPVGSKLVQLDISVEQADLASARAILREAVSPSNVRRTSYPSRSHPRRTSIRRVPSVIPPKPR